MQGDGTSSGMTESSQTGFRAPSPRGLAARWRGMRVGAGRRTGVRGARRLHRRAVPEGLHPAARRARANSDRRQPGPGADRDGHAVHGRDAERRGVLLHLAARRTQGRVHEPAGGRPARDRDLFRQEPPGAAARQLRAAGRQDLRLHQPHHADLGPGTQLPRRRCSSCSASTSRTCPGRGQRLRRNRVQLAGSQRTTLRARAARYDLRQASACRPPRIPYAPCKKKTKQGENT